MDDDKLSTRDIASSAGEAAGPRTARTVSAGSMMDQQVATERHRDAPEQAAEERTAEPLFPSEEGHGYRTRWDAVQTGFVDEPRRAVEEADNLVADVMKRLAGVFADERSALERQWSKGDQVSTEDLRVALRRYRTFFQRLLDI